MTPEIIYLDTRNDRQVYYSEPKYEEVNPYILKSKYDELKHTISQHELAYGLLEYNSKTEISELEREVARLRENLASLSKGNLLHLVKIGELEAENERMRDKIISLENEIDHHTNYSSEHNQ